MPVDQQTFVELTTRNQNRLYRFILALVPNYSLAEELHQQTVLTLWEKRNTYDADRPFLPWAFQIARNHVLNHRRKQGRRGPSFPLTENCLERVAASAARKQELLDRRRDALRGCMDDLPASQQEILDAHYEQDRTLKSIADDSGTSSDALYKSLQRIRKALFDCVNRKLALES